MSKRAYGDELLSSDEVARSLNNPPDEPRKAMYKLDGDYIILRPPSIERRKLKNGKIEEYVSIMLMGLHNPDDKEKDLEGIREDIRKFIRKGRPFREGARIIIFNVGTVTDKVRRSTQQRLSLVFKYLPTQGGNFYTHSGIYGLPVKGETISGIKTQEILNIIQDCIEKNYPEIPPPSLKH